MHHVSRVFEDYYFLLCSYIEWKFMFFLLFCTQGYGMTETGGVATTMSDSEESKRYGSAGRLAANMQGKIVDPGTGEALPLGQQGELWLQGPNIMKGDAFTLNTLILTVV